MKWNLSKHSMPGDNITVWVSDGKEMRKAYRSNGYWYGKWSDDNIRFDVIYWQIYTEPDLPNEYNIEGGNRDNPD